MKNRKEYLRNYYQRNKEKYREYKKNHREQRLATCRRHHQKIRRIVLEHYGNKCACCGENRIEFLQIDHINGDGNKFRKTITQSIYTWIRKNNFPKDLQILCANCNVAKAYYGYCPHKREKQ